MTIGAANKQTQFNQLAWETLSPFNSKAYINPTHFVIRIKFPLASLPAQYNVFENNAAMPGNLTINEQTFSTRLNSGYYGTPEPAPPQIIYTPPPVIPTTPPVNDPTGPGTTTGNFYEDNKFYIYAAAAILIIAYFEFKK